MKGFHIGSLSKSVPGINSPFLCIRAKYLFSLINVSDDMGEIFPFHLGLFSRLLAVMPKIFISAWLLLPFVRIQCTKLLCKCVEQQ